MRLVNGVWVPAERGIVMSAESIRSIRERRKSQTRRVVTPQPPTPIYAPGYPKRSGREPGEWYFATQSQSPTWNGMVVTVRQCPFGEIGDRLYVKETWAGPFLAPRGGPGVLYRADLRDGWTYPAVDRWRSPRFMPKRFARMWLEVTDIRAERIADISELDALAEGVEGRVGAGVLNGVAGEYVVESAREAFMRRWDTLNARRGYGSATNCWAWALTFTEITP